MKGVYCFLLLAAVLLLLASITGREKNSNEQNNILTVVNNSKDQSKIMTVKGKYEGELMAIPGVVGVGISECKAKACIIVFIHNRTAQIDREIPKTLDGYPVQIEVTGSIKTLPQ